MSNITAEQLVASLDHSLVPPGYSVCANGVYLDDKSPARVTNTACWVSGKLRDASGNRWSLRIHLVNEDGEERIRVIPYGVLQGSAVSAVLEDLAHSGLLYPEGPRAFQNYLLACASQSSLPKLTSVGQLGFFEAKSSQGHAALGFMLPSGPLYAEESRPGDCDYTVFQPLIESESVKAYAARGTLAEWQALVQPLANSPLHVVAVCSAAAAPFLGMASLENGGINFHGQSSCGKTTALQLAVSLWGNGSDPQRAGNQPTMIERWNSTPNAMEPVVAGHSNMVLALDELGSAPEVNVYNIIGGVGKSRMRKDCSLQGSTKWQILLLSSGEESIQAKIEMDGKRKARTGEVIRILDVPVDRLPPAPGLSSEDMRERIDAAKAGCGLTYGTAGPEFIRQVLAEFPDGEALRVALAGDLRKAKDRLCEEVLASGTSLSSPLRRGMERLALIEVIGTWACDTLGFTPEQVAASVRKVRDAWLSGAARSSITEQAREALTSYVLRHRENIVSDEVLASDPGAYRPSRPRGITRNGLLMLSSEEMDEVLEGLPAESALKALFDAGLLVKHKEAQYTSKRTLPGHGFSARFYTFRMDKIVSFDLSQDDHEDEGQAASAQ